MSAQGSGRYTRSSVGMVGAMIVTVGVILAFVAFRAINRDDLEVQREEIDYLSSVQELQKVSEVKIVYPPALPEGLKAVDIKPTDANGWSLDILSDDGDEFIGIYQGVSGVADWVKKYVDENPTRGDVVTLDSAVAKKWQSWSDAGGDYAVTSKHQGQVVMVFGSADDDLIREVAASLTTKPVR
ncbi:DUF4245 family protein [Nocardioides sp. JQ2195]|uniref:DUF4245 family protein n=1 Tax=Nocardioides sp. JQ2195 TaxID=2592334 RepID=UPI00143EAD68|nr:DUF4245 family protein [Nocardioides sp. JQ2195]QIX27723.1 DUF4245 family protein [Nocardioides sp. JQ2195]